VSNSSELENAILKEMHNVAYVGHRGYQKKIEALRQQYFWPGMMTDYISQCLECQKVKTEHRHPTCLLQPLPI